MGSEYTEFKRLLTLRKAKNKTIAEMSQETDVSASAISNYERGIRSPDADTLIKLAQYFDCTTDYLLGLCEFQNPREQKDNKEKAGQIEVFIDGFSRRAKERLFFIYQAIANSYQRVCGYENDIDNTLLLCFEVISEAVADTTLRLYTRPYWDGDETREKLQLYTLTDERTCLDKIRGLYDNFGDRISAIYIEEPPADN